MKDVAADKAEFAFEVEGREDLAGDDGNLEAGRVRLDRVDHEVGDRLARLVPRAPVRQLGRDMLAEQRRDMAAGGASELSRVEGISISMIGCADQPLSRASKKALSM